VHAGRSVTGQRAAASRTAATATPLITREALFRQAGIIATDSLGELVDTAALLATQPLPAGPRVAVVSNVGGAGVLAADACSDHGLTVHRLTGETRRRLHALIPPSGAVTGPVNTTTTVSEHSYQRCLELAAADEGVDAIIALALPTAATGNLTAAIRAARIHIPLAAVILDQREPVQLLPRTSPAQQDQPGPAQPAGPAGAIPSYAYPEAAVRALAHAVTYSAWRARPTGHLREFTDVTPDNARALVRKYLTRHPKGGWLPPETLAALLAHYGVQLISLTPVASADDAVRAAADLGGPIVLKADVPGLLNKADAGAVQLDLRTDADIRRAYRVLSAKFGRLRQILMQPMITGGTEVMIGITQEPMFGPLVVFGPGGVDTDGPTDHTARLAPLTDADADELIRSAPSAPLLLGHRGSPAADLPALQDLLLRISRLADDLPEVAELDLNPVIACPGGVSVVDARIHITPAQPYDPFLRRLR
jgi:acyl-CoA synthetase (NDP forming)